MERYQSVVKFMLVGDSGVGKTSLMRRFTGKPFSAKELTTVGLEYGERVLLVQGKKVMVQLWDTAGQERFKSLTPSYYRSAMGILLVFSVDDRQSFNSIAIWMKQISSLAGEETPVVLVGNKNDLVRRQVSSTETIALAQTFNVDLILTSCKDNVNIDDAVIRLYHKIYVPRSGVTCQASEETSDSPKTNLSKSRQNRVRLAVKPQQETLGSNCSC